MMKRLRWMIIGAGAGVAVYLWATRRAKESLPRAGGDLVQQAQQTARDVGARLREAMREGRLVAGERDRELRRELLQD